ncbi:hypothetical protein TNCV_3702771 [Trichonephila clavipes]|nr:hypothetical protein TNCV_3702771 [Trichonephila clavipes]
MIYGTCRGGDVITGVEESDDGCSCRQRWSSLRNSVAREDALRLAETGKDSPSLKVLFWNAGGLTIDKFIELKAVISKESPDAIGITESDSSADNLRFFPLKGYKSYSLGRSRQIASGIVIFVKNDLTAEPLLKHAMTSSDSLEAIELRVWKRNIGYSVSFLYNPPRNKPDLNSLLHDWNKHSFILGDFNAHSTRWGYVQNCPVGNLVEDFIDTNEIDFIENSTASPLCSMVKDVLSFLSYLGWRVRHVLQSSPDMITCKPICLRLSWLIHRFALSEIPCQ